jgi:hypothetical protein
MDCYLPRVTDNVAFGRIAPKGKGKAAIRSVMAKWTLKRLRAKKRG